MGQTYAQARQQHGESELLDDLVSSPPAMEPGRVRSPDQIPTVSRQRLGEAVAILEAKASPEEVATYKRFVVAVAEAAAGAHREGGFAGIGGQQVSEAEQAALDDMAATLESRAP